MTLLLAVGLALESLGRNKLRTGLTMLGMVIGVTAVIAMVALGTGAQQAIVAQIQTAGTNLVIVTAGNFTAGVVRMGQGAANTLTAEDAEAIRREIPGVRYLAAGLTTRGQVIAGSQNWSTRIQGTDVDLPLMRSWPIRYGSFFSEPDVASGARVAVLGSVVSEMLFGSSVDPVGEIVRLNRQPFRIVGVMASKGQAAMGEDQDDTIFVPFTTVQKRLMGVSHVNNITMSAATAEGTGAVAEDVARLLRQRHRLGPGEPDDFMVRTLEEMASVRSAATQTMTILLASIAAVSLLVGGIGIMNIMLVSVTERTREIGLRLAVGARRRDVLLQFLVEAVVLSIIGGLLGVGLGFGISAGMRSLLAWPTAVSPESVALAVGFAAATGVGFGLVPARRAASLDPIEALRYE